jgi:Integrase core domain
VEDQGIRREHIKPAPPQLIGKVERSHRTVEQEFYQLLTYTDDIGLRARPSEWEKFYNLSKPHDAFNEKHLTNCFVNDYSSPVDIS